MALLTEKRVTELPDPVVFDNILTRDASSFDILDTDTKEQKEVKMKGLQLFELMFDFYVEKMLASCAGMQVWGPSVKYYEEVSQSLMPNSEKALRITASTEAFTVLIYKNCWKKWNAMHKSMQAFHQSNMPGKWACPRFNKKKQENLEYETPYTDSASGQKKIGGYTNEGMQEYRRLKNIVMANRKDQKERVSAVESASILRLQQKNHLSTNNNQTTQPAKTDNAPADWEDWTVEDIA